jgi:hypothetical protein
MADTSRTGCSPLFATVVFMNDTNEPCHTFRVPITETTSVRRLAKDALQRLFYSVRSANKDTQPTDFAVKEIRVGEHMAEIFPQDVVIQMVAVRDEKIFMKLGGKATLTHNNSGVSVSGGSSANVDTHTASASNFSGMQASSLAGSHSVGHALSSSSASPPHAVVLQPSPPSVVNQAVSTSLLVSERSMDLTSSCTSRCVVGPQHQQKQECCPPTLKACTVPAAVRSRSPERERSTSPPPVAASAARGARKPPVDTPQTTADTRKQRLLPRTSPKRRGVRDGEQVTPEAARVIDTENLTSRQAAKLLEKKSGDSHLGWAPGSMSYFPSNYLSNPDDIRKRLAARPAVTKVSRDVFGSISDNDDEGRASRINFDRPPCIDVDAQPPSAPPAGSAAAEERPKGWGTEALQYFHRSYASDPNKAKLTVEEMNEPRKSRRRLDVKYS